MKDMNLNDFVLKFEEQLEEVTPGTIKPETVFRELPEWDSMGGLVIIAMIDREYNKQVTGDEMVSAQTVADLFNIIDKK